MDLSALQPGGFAHGPDEKNGRLGLAMGLGARSACAATASVNVTLLAESSRRVGTAWPRAVSKGECGAGKAVLKDSRCESQTIDAALHNSLNLLKSGCRDS